MGYSLVLWAASVSGKDIQVTAVDESVVSLRSQTDPQSPAVFLGQDYFLRHTNSALDKSVKASANYVELSFPKNKTVWTSASVALTQHATTNSFRCDIEDTVSWSKNWEHDANNAVHVYGTALINVANASQQAYEVRITIFATHYADVIVDLNGQRALSTGAGQTASAAIALQPSRAIDINLHNIFPVRLIGTSELPGNNGSRSHRCSASIQWTPLADGKSGENPDHPILWTRTVGGPGPSGESYRHFLNTVLERLIGRYGFSAVGSSNWVSLPVQQGLAVLMESNTLCNAIVNLPTNSSGGGSYHVQAGTNDLGVFHPGETVDFVGLLGAGVGDFALYSEDGAPMDIHPMPFQLVFNKTTASFESEVLRTPLEPELLHRYSFDAAPDAAVVKDSEGSRNGALFNADHASYLPSGQLRLTGGDADSTSAPFVDLGPGIISSLKRVTIEGWATWNGPTQSKWQRVFDFGSSLGGIGSGYMFLTPSAGDRNGVARFACTPGYSGDETRLDADAPFAIGVPTHFAVVYDPVAGRVNLYINGVRIVGKGTPGALGAFLDQNCWLGKSQWRDSYFNGSLDEFRIYDAALTDEQVKAHFEAGPGSVVPQKISLMSQRDERGVELAWPADPGADYGLQAAPGVNGPWTAIEGSSSQDEVWQRIALPVGKGDKARFFRLLKAKKN